jgi:hypothetical protein
MYNTLFPITYTQILSTGLFSLHIFVKQKIHVIFNSNSR